MAHDPVIADRLELLTTSEMARADQAAVVLGIDSLVLMENAGRAVAEVAFSMVDGGAVITILCGPGNNGGDGFVAARHLDQAGYRVHLVAIADPESLRGDAGEMARRWRGQTAPAEQAANLILQSDLVIDALFGAGLTRALDGAAADIVEALNASQCKVLAVDVPSGLDGSTGRAEGHVVKATATTTFFRQKPGHLLLPGRVLCGTMKLADIGIPPEVLAEIAPKAFRNSHRLWGADWPLPDPCAHKYARGHVVVLSGPAHATGAARLAARGALRVGAGLVTVASPPDAVGVNSAQLTAVMVAPMKGRGGLGDVLADNRKNSAVVGPGAGVGGETRENVLQALASPAAIVLDADALTTFADDPEPLFSATRARRPFATVLTPHEGEYARLFGPSDSDKLGRARAAAIDSGAIVVLKGADTVIASPDGRVAINDNAPPWLATAGSGDVLAGFIGGLLAQAMPSWQAACAAVWLHGACATRFGPGLIAEDLPEVLPVILKSLSENQLAGTA